MTVEPFGITWTNGATGTGGISNIRNVTGGASPVAILTVS